MALNPIDSYKQTRFTRNLAALFTPSDEELHRVQMLYGAQWISQWDRERLREEIRDERVDAFLEVYENR